MAEEALRSTSLNANFHRLTRLLMRGGVQFLRETFDSIHSPADLPLRLADRTIQAQLRGARLTQPEKDCLYPPGGGFGKSNDFDITLIFKLFRTICGMTPPPGPRGWDDLPNKSDHTLVADIVRIKYYRNKIYGHCPTMEISDIDFNHLWEEIRKALLRIATNISPAKRDEWEKSIDDLLFNPLTPNEEGLIKELETWYMQDANVRNEIVKLKQELREEQRFLNATFAGVQEERFNEELETLYKQNADVKNEIVKLRQELKEEMRFLNATFAGRQEMLTTLRVLEKLDLTKLNLKIVISEDQNEKGKKLLEASSGEIAESLKVQLAYEKALKDGYVTVYRGRIIILGQARAGKTSLKKSLLGLPFGSEEQSTGEIEVDPSKCEIDVDQTVRKWQSVREKKPGLLEYSKDVAKIVAEKFLTQEDDLPRKMPMRREKLREEETDKSTKEDFEKDSAHISPADFDGYKQGRKKVEDEGDYPSVDTMQNVSIEHSMDCILDEPEIFIDVATPSDTVKHVHQWLEYLRGKRIKNGLFKEESHITVDIWDFNGQHLYYASHHIFLSQRALYILVHNLSKPLDAKAKPCRRQGSYEVELENANNETNMENLLSWLATVKRVASLTDDTDDDAQHKLPYLCPPVFIVGTHADKPVEDIAVIKKQIEERISGTEYEAHVIVPLFCIDNTQRPNLMKKLIQKISKRTGKRKTAGAEGKADGINELQNKLMAVLWQEPYMGEKIPVRWFLFEKVIEALVAKQIYHRNLQQLEHYAKKDCFIEDVKEFESMISFYHDMGTIIKHRNTVVLKTQWLIDLFKQLITIPPYNKQNARYAIYWRELEGSGILSMDYVDHVFSSFIGQRIIKGDILDMMEQFGLIAKFSASPTDEKYFVPAHLKSSPVELSKIEPSSTDPCPLYLLFVHGFVPHGLFSQLVSRSIHWCSKTWALHQPLLYQNGAWFIIGKDIHDFVLICKTGFVKVTLTQRKAQSDQVEGQNSVELTTLVREFLEDTLKNLSQEMPYLRGMKYRMCVACPYCHQGAEETRRACSDHVKTTCSRKDCFHLIDANEGQPAICNRKACKIVPPVCGLKKWFLKRRSQGLSSSNVAARSHDEASEIDPIKSASALKVWDIIYGSFDRIIQELQQMQLDASKVKSRTDLSLGLRNIALDKGFRISDNEGLGNCMFYALSDQLEIVKGIKIPHGELRQTLVQYLRSNPKLPDGTDLFHFVHGHQTWTEYLVHMEEDGAWGDHVILCAAANYFETCIRVVSSLSRSNDVIITPHCSVDKSKPLVLGHIHEVHYVSLQPV